MEGVLEAIRARVCSHCIDANQNGQCTLSSESTCPVELYTSSIVQAIASVNSDDYPAYIAALRADVCRDCKYGSADACDLRDQIDCPLDRYYPMVIDVVEEFLQQSVTT
jgi:hypothetical protein